VALELLADSPGVETVLVAIGGVGNIRDGSRSEITKAFVRIIGVEPEGSPTLKASLDAGRVVPIVAVTTRVATMGLR